MISIIIPVYNVKQYLSDCLDGILSQTYTDWECILVDDGSTDGSTDVCDSYEQRDARFKAIHKENGGVSSARNRGLDVARGEWVTFIDADDRITAHFLHSLIEPADENDELVVGGNRYFGLDEGETVPPENRIVQREDFKNYIFTDIDWTWQRIFYVVWGKLFRLSIIKENRLLFDTNMIRSEDTTFMLLYMTFIRKVKLLKVKEYSYRFEMSNKAYYTFSVERFIAQQSSYMNAMNIVCKSDIGSFVRMIKRSRQLCFSLFLSSLVNKNEFIESIKEYRKYDDDLFFLSSDLKHFFYYKIIMLWPSIGYVLTKILKK